MNGAHHRHFFSSDYASDQFRRKRKQEEPCIRI
jgi:hypothetical protein